MKGRDHLEDLGVDERMILKIVAGPFEHSNKPSDFINSSEFPDSLRDCNLLKKASDPWS
jgi:hypothetical protein